MTSFSGVRYVLFCFLFVFMLSLNPRPFVESSFDTRFSLSMEMSRLTRDGTAEPVLSDQILRREHGQGNIHFSYSAHHEQDWQPYPVDPYSCHTCDHTSCRGPDRHTCFFLSFFHFSFFFYLNMSLFSEYFCTIAAFSLNGEYVVRSSLPNGDFFYLVTTGWVFEISLCENPIQFNSIQFDDV